MKMEYTLRTLTVFLVAAYLLTIPLCLTIIPPRLGVLAICVVGILPSALALAAAASLLWFKRSAPVVCLLLPAWITIQETIGAFQRSTTPSWLYARDVLWLLKWICLLIAIHVGLKMIFANKPPEDTAHKLADPQH